MSVHKTPEGNWYAKWYEGKKPKKAYFGHGDAGRLQAIARDREIKESKGKAPEHVSLSVDDLCHEYHARHDVAASTHLQNTYRFNNHLSRLLGKYSADRLATREIDLYLRRRIENDGVKRATVSGEIRLLKAVYSWATSQTPPLVHANPVSGYKVKIGTDEKDVPMPPTVDEIRRIFARAEPHMARAIKIHWHSGIRPGGELLRLRWDGIDFQNHEMRVYSAHKGGPVIRTIPISTDLEPDLQQWFAEDRGVAGDTVWELPVVHYEGRGVKSLKRAWATAKRRAGITRKMRLYDLRHAFASNALRAGGDLKSVSEVLGHSRPDTTLREYQHVTREQHREIVDLIPAVELGTVGTIIPMVRRKVSNKTE